MCLISVLPKGTEKYSDKVTNFIRQGFECNKDGSGYMFKRHGSDIITVRKGFNVLSKLLDSIKKDNIKKEDELVVHHRIRTSGYVDAKNCHPYVVSEYEDEVIDDDISIDKPCIAHNGTIKGLDHYEIMDNYKYSDTYIFARYFLSNNYLLEFLKKTPNEFKDVFKYIINGSRLAILMPDRDIVMLGNFIADEEYFHSNEGYCKNIYNRGGIDYNKHYDHLGKYVFPDNLSNKVDDYILFDINDIILTTENYTKFSVIKEESINNKHIYYSDLYSLDQFIAKGDLHVSLKRDKVYYTYIDIKNFYKNYRFIIPKYTVDDDFNFTWLLYSDYNRLLKNIKSIKNNEKLGQIIAKIKRLLNLHRRDEEKLVITDPIFNEGFLYLQSFKLIYPYCLCLQTKNKQLKLN